MPTHYSICLPAHALAFSVERGMLGVMGLRLVDELDWRRESGFGLCAKPKFGARGSDPGLLRGSRDAELYWAAEAGRVLGV